MNNDSDYKKMEMMAVIAAVCIVAMLFFYALPLIIAGWLWRYVPIHKREKALKSTLSWAIGSFAVGLFLFQEAAASVVMAYVVIPLTIIEYSWRNLLGISEKEPEPIREVNPIPPNNGFNDFIGNDDGLYDFDFDPDRFSDRKKQKEYEDRKRAHEREPWNTRHKAWIARADTGEIEGIKALPAAKKKTSSKAQWNDEEFKQKIREVSPFKQPTPASTKPVIKRSAWTSNVKPSTAVNLGWDEIKSARYGGQSSHEREYESKEESMYDEIPSKRTKRKMEAERADQAPWLNGREGWPDKAKRQYKNYYDRHLDDASTPAEKSMCLKAMQRLNENFGVKVSR